MKISVIIPTLSNKRAIKIAVRSAFSVADKVIVVDSYSTDRTVEITEKEGRQSYLG